MKSTLPFPSLNSWRIEKYLAEDSVHVRLFVDVVEHADEQADVAVEGHVELLLFLDFFVRLDRDARVNRGYIEVWWKKRSASDVSSSFTHCGFSISPWSPPRYQNQDLGLDALHGARLVRVFLVLHQPQLDRHFLVVDHFEAAVFFSSRYFSKGPSPPACPRRSSSASRHRVPGRRLALSCASDCSFKYSI